MTASRPPDPKRRQLPARHGLFEGEIASAPTAAADTVEVVIDRLDGRRQLVSGALWTPPGATWPAPGDPCAVAFTDRRRPVVVWWRPAS